MTFNLESEGGIVCCNIEKWSPLAIDVCTYVATAKLAAFQEQAARCGELFHLGLIQRAEAADILHEAAVYNGLGVEYGADRIQGIIAAAFAREAAAC